ncbi:MAG: nitroreductase [Hyphomicrobium aestuarii]|nr:nitroreductase [Hyphomicrobium aestuarii]
MSEATTNPMLDLLATRRSVKPDRLAAPGPTPDELHQILTIAARVPDHKKLAPWRFIVFEGDARFKAGEIFAEACRREDKEPPSDKRIETERNRLARAPLVVAVVSRTVDNPFAPEWEQVLSCGAACYNMCLAANAMGFGTNWLTDWVSYSAHVREGLGLAANERLAGFVYIGTAMERSPERERPAISDIVSHWPA